MVEYRCCIRANFVRCCSSLSILVALGIKQHDRASSWENVARRCLSQKIVCCRGCSEGQPLHSHNMNGQYQKRSNICMYRVRVILILWVGIDHPIHYFTLLFLSCSQNLYKSNLSVFICFKTSRINVSSNSHLF